MLNISLEHVNEKDRVLNFRVYLDDGMGSVTVLGGWRAINGYICPPSYPTKGKNWVNLFFAARSLQKVVYELVARELDTRPRVQPLRNLEDACNGWLLNEENLAKLAPKVYKARSAEKTLSAKEER